MMRSLLSSVAYALASAIVVCSIPASAAAQSYQGGMRGSVKDAQGVIPGVTVTLVNEANGVSRDTISNAVGEYSFPAVDPGAYFIKATVQGYKTFERKAIPASVRVAPERAETSPAAIESVKSPVPALAAVTRTP